MPEVLVYVCIGALVAALTEILSRVVLSDVDTSVDLSLTLIVMVMWPLFVLVLIVVFGSMLINALTKKIKEKETKE